jgi:hypothetical protein
VSLPSFSTNSVQRELGTPLQIYVAQVSVGDDRTQDIPLVRSSILECGQDPRLASIW